MSQSQQVQSNRPLHPQELFNRLLHFNTKNVQCICESQKLQQQKRVLYKLLEEYSQQIIKLRRQDIQRQRLKQIRAKLQLQSQQLSRQKLQIAAYIKRDIDQLKVTPVEIAQKQQWDIQISLLKQSSHRKRVKIEQLRQYIKKMDIINRKLEQQRKLATIYNNENCNINSGVQQTYLNYLKQLRTQQSCYTNELRIRMQEQQQEARRSVQEAQLQIADRNRKRYQQFQMNQRRNQMLNRMHQLSVMQQEQQQSQLVNRLSPTLRIPSRDHYQYPRII